MVRGPVVFLRRDDGLVEKQGRWNCTAYKESALGYELLEDGFYLYKDMVFNSPEAALYEISLKVPPPSVPPAIWNDGKGGSFVAVSPVFIGQPSIPFEATNSTLSLKIPCKSSDSEEMINKALIETAAEQVFGCSKSMLKLEWGTERNTMVIAVPSLNPILLFKSMTKHVSK